VTKLVDRRFKELSRALKVTKLVDQRFKELSRAVRAVQAVGAVAVVLKVNQISVLDLFARAGYQN
jgi:hypothetical protein